MFDTKTNLLSDSIVKSLLVFAFPMFLSNIFQQLYNTADIVIMAQGLCNEDGALLKNYEAVIGKTV